METIHLQRRALGTNFELWLNGDDPGYLTGAGCMALHGEVFRIDRLLSRFNPDAEIVRVNRHAVEAPVKVSYELFAILEECRQWFDETEGYFDLCAGCGVSFPEGVRLDASRRTVHLVDPRVQLDFGAFGRGYALDATTRIFDRDGIASALLHAGTGAILARGIGADLTPWPVSIRDPFSNEPRELRQLPLSDCALATAVFDPQTQQATVLDPVAGQPLLAPAACAVVAPTALEAVVLSTALLAMGKPRAAMYLAMRPLALAQRVFWIETRDDTVSAVEIYTRTD